MQACSHAAAAAYLHAYSAACIYIGVVWGWLFVQVFVQVLDACFENVCELDLVFHYDKVNPKP